MTNDGLRLSGDEIAVAEAYLDRMEKKARKWEGRRILVLVLVVVCAYSGLWNLNEFVRDLLGRDEVMEKLQTVEIPQGVPVEQWMAGYVRKVAAVYEFQERENNLLLFTGNVGLLGLIMAAILSNKLIAGWNAHKRELLIARIMRHYMKEWSPGTEERVAG
jgi:hypothetical protein